MSIETIRIEIAELEARLAELREELKAALEPQLNTYPSVEEIDWPAERLEDSPETRARYNQKFFTWAITGSNPKSDFYPPYKNVIVPGVGEVEKMGGTGWDAENQRGGSGGPDYTHIARGVYDVAAPQWVRIVDPDGKRTAEDIEALFRNYRGGLRYPLSTWDSHTVGAAYKAIFLQTHDDPGVEYGKRQIPVTPAG